MPGTRTSPTNSAAVSRNSLGYLSRPNQRIRGASRGLGMIDSRLAGEDDVGAHHATTGRMYGVDSSWRQFRAVAGKLHSGRGCWNCRSEERRVGKEWFRRVDLGGRRIINNKTHNT